MKSRASAKEARLARELFDYFSSLCPYATDSLSDHKIKFAAEMVSDLGMPDARLVVEFSIQNWDLFRNLDQKLIEKPNFYQITAPWNYTKWLRMIQNNEIEKLKKREASENYKRNEAKMRERMISRSWGIVVPPLSEVRARQEAERKSMCLNFVKKAKGSSAATLSNQDEIREHEVEQRKKMVSVFLNKFKKKEED